MAFFSLLILLNQIRWENRLIGDTGERCLVTIDGIDFMIPEPTPFSKAWWSHKFNGPGLRCEIAVCIKTGWIVAYNGPFACGSWPDLKIFRSRLKQWLLRGEKVVADRGYRGDSRVCHPDNANDRQHSIAMFTARSRHETVNGRLKFWNCLKQVFRHSRDKHHLVFRAVLVIEQIKIQNGQPPFQVTDYLDPILAWE
jgi:DDE superfamily endonuclease